jgi:hypothetical protein
LLWKLLQHNANETRRGSTEIPGIHGLQFIVVTRYPTAGTLTGRMIRRSPSHCGLEGGSDEMPELSQAARDAAVDAINNHALTVTAGAAKAGVSAQTFYVWIREGRVPAFRIAN